MANRRRWAGAGLRLLAGLVAIALVLATGSLALAQEKEKKKSSKKNFVPSESVGKRLLRVSEYADEENWAEAEGVLEPLTNRKRLKRFDRASIFQAYGQILAAQGKYKEALDALETALSIDYLPDANMQGLRYNLAQLYMAEENFPRAVELLTEWMSLEEKPSAQAEWLLAAAYVQTEKWEDALPHARRAVELSTTPVENRLQMRLAVEFQNGNLLESLETLKQLSSHFPRKRYFKQLAAAYSGLGEDDNALATLELADQQGWLTEEREVLQLAQRYLFADLPWQASEAMRRGFEAEVVEKSADNLSMYANALLAAREYDDAITPLGEAAELAEDGNLYVRLAQVHLQVENWGEARGALSSAVAKGGLDNPGNANLLLGIANYNQERWDSARKAFQAALRDEKTEENARRWLGHVDRAEEQQAAL